MHISEMIQATSVLSGLMCLTFLLLAAKKQLKAYARAK